jgi:UDP-GlcNAc:undecaprenyl-phosphate GlcNAc-1-phosphate transferase
MGFEPMLFCLLLGCLISLLIIPLMLLPALRRSLPLQERRKATDPFVGRERFVVPERENRAPRAGGVALAAAFLGVSLLIVLLYPAAWTKEGPISLGIVWTALAMFLIGLWDDFQPLGRGRRLLIQTLISVAACAQGVRIDTFIGPFGGVISNLGAWNNLVTVLWLVGLTNLFHRINAINGLAGGVGFVLMALLAYASAGTGAAFSALGAIGMAGALLGFLVYNLPPTRIYLGSGGAALIGFLAGNFSIVHPDKDTAMAASLVLILPALGLCLAVWPRSPKVLPSVPAAMDPGHRRLSGLGNSRPRARF